MLLHFGTIYLAIVWYNDHVLLILFIACFYFLGEKLGFMVSISCYLWIPNLKLENIDFNYVLDGLYLIEDHPKPHTLSL